jgi:hypothetical protein
VNPSGDGLDERRRAAFARLARSRGVPEVGRLSCCAFVFVDEAAEDVTAAELSCDQRLRFAIALWALGRRQVEAAVGTMVVVVPDVAVEDTKEVAAAGEQEMIQAFPAHGADPALGDGVGVRRLDRRTDDLRSDRAPEVIEGPGELAVAVAEQEPDDSGLLIERRDEVAGLLRDPGAGGLAVTPARRTRRWCSWMKNSTYSRCTNSVSTVRKSQARMPAAWRRRNDRQVVDVAARRGAGWRPLARRTLAMVLAEIRQPRPSSSPRLRC